MPRSIAWARSTSLRFASSGDRFSFTGCSDMHFSFVIGAAPSHAPWNGASRLRRFLQALHVSIFPRCGVDHVTERGLAVHAEPRRHDRNVHPSGVRAFGGVETLAYHLVEFKVPGDPFRKLQCGHARNLDVARL